MKLVITMKSIKTEVKVELVINKSTFINYLLPVSDLTMVKTTLETLKTQYPDASHYPYAYLLGNNQEIQKASDDGEPSKTAGYPMMEVLKKHRLTNVLNVSIRYYGGIKLGAGGLTRAYSKGCALSVAEVVFTTLQSYTQIVIEIPFHHIGNVEKYIRDNYPLLDTKYSDFVSYIIDVKTIELADFKTLITNFTKGEAHFETLKTFDRYE